MNKILIVNADDFGMHEDLNTGIVDAFHTGNVRSTSLMVNMPATAHACDLAKSAPSLEIGLHLNITSLRAVAPSRLVDRLVDSDGHFLFDGTNIPESMRWLRAAVAEDSIFVSQIETEFKCQHDRFLGLGLELAHLNIHHYVALLHPRIFEAYVRAAEVAGVPFRGLCYPMVDFLHISAENIAQMAACIEASSARAPSLSVSNLADTTSEHPGVDEYISQILLHLDAVFHDPARFAVEVVTHPATLSSEVLRRDSYVWARRLETALVHSAELRRLAFARGWRFAGYKALSSSPESGAM